MIRKCKTHGYFRGEQCPECGEQGRYVLDDSREERMGRFVSGVLRHFPQEVGLSMELEGWVDMDALCDIMEDRYRWATKERFISLVESDVKNRYEIQGSSVRARYGHSVNVDLDYPENEISPLYYGVSQEEVDMLLENGIAPMRQRYVHLSTSYDRAREAASVHTESPVVLEICASEAQEDGLCFLHVNDNIVLAEEVPAEYVDVAGSDE
ncbi:MAG: RNA 2'-phosphotransferase [Euryarchaeota archaeon]|nr:RNA 2'-phosphotransferase [Euryarchaeota archaeon]